MALRVKLKMRRSETSITTSALVNSGFEAEEPQLIIPMKLAEALGSVDLPASIEDLSVAGEEGFQAIELRVYNHRAYTGR